MSRKVVLIVAVMALYLASLPGAALGAPPTGSPGAAGIGDPYYPLDGNGGYDVQHYGLKLRYDPATDGLTGEATITARATQALSAFNLDFVGLRLRSLTVNGVRAGTTRLGQELTVTPKTGLANGATFTIVARYDGVPQTLEDFGKSGFIHTDDGAIVIGEPHVASSWFPANDHPRDKAAFTFQITVPAGIEAVSNGVLTGQQTNAGWTTWSWNAVEPMAPYLATMAIGQFDVSAYTTGGIHYWDAIDSVVNQDLAGPVVAANGAQFLYSQVGEPAYKRLTQTIAVPAGGATLTFQADRDTEPGWDFLFVETRTPGSDDWTTVADVNGHTSQETGACPGFVDEFNPFLSHYLTPVLDEGDPTTPDDDVFTCTPTGTSGAWNAASGLGDGWETWSIPLANPTASTVQREVSITYASDGFVQGRGVALDSVVVSTGQGSTSFEADGNVLDGWVAPLAGPAGSAANPNTWIPATTVGSVPGIGASAQVSLDRQPEILAFEAATFGPYPFSASGGIVDDAGVGFALENQTRPTYSPDFFGGPEGNDFVVVHELAHQWYGDSLAVDTWQHIWLNEGFATYAEWLWSEREGFDTTQQIYEDFTGIPAEEDFWNLAIGDPGPDQLFDFPVYARGALTLHALRLAVGPGTFFRILKEWSRTQAGGTVTTREFIDLAESISHKELDPLFAVWLSSGKPPIGNGHGPNALSVRDLTAAGRSLVERLHDKNGQPFKGTKAETR
jgi:Peptidase family M1 domain/Peptidase M1 N-terminal domain